MHKEAITTVQSIITVEKNIIHKANQILLEYLNEFNTSIIDGSLDLYSFEVGKDNNYEIIFSYYRPNNTIPVDLTDPKNYQMRPFGNINIKNYKKIVLDKNGNLLKISSKIDN